MPKNLWWFPAADVVVEMSETKMRTLCLAIEREILEKYGGKYSVSYEFVPTLKDDKKHGGRVPCLEVALSIDDTW